MCQSWWVCVGECVCWLFCAYYSLVLLLLLSFLFCLIFNKCCGFIIVCLLFLSRVRVCESVVCVCVCSDYSFDCMHINFMHFLIALFLLIAFYNILFGSLSITSRILVAWFARQSVKSEREHSACERESECAGGGRRCHSRGVCVSCELIVSLEWMRISDSDSDWDGEQRQRQKQRQRQSE